MRAALCLALALAGCAGARPSEPGRADLGTGPVGGGGAPADLAMAPTDLASRPADLSSLPFDLSVASQPDLSTTVADLSTAPADLARPPDLGVIDPGVGLADPSGLPCSTPGSLGECPLLDVCRFYTPTESRCESCSNCGNLHALCTASQDCDILFVCYQGRCENFCMLGTSECGAVADCIDVGHPTEGVCRN
jgi:hypothetical protein